MSELPVVVWVRWKVPQKPLYARVPAFLIDDALTAVSGGQSEAPEAQGVQGQGVGPLPRCWPGRVVRRTLRQSP